MPIRRAASDIVTALAEQVRTDFFISPLYSAKAEKNETDKAENAMQPKYKTIVNLLKVKPIFWVNILAKGTAVSPIIAPNKEKAVFMNSSTIQKCLKVKP